MLYILEYIQKTDYTLLILNVKKKPIIGSGDCVPTIFKCKHIIKWTLINYVVVVFGCDGGSSVIELMAVLIPWDQNFLVLCILSVILLASSTMGSVAKSGLLLDLIIPAISDG